jgi:hypothetical protein
LLLRGDYRVNPVAGRRGHAHIDGAARKMRTACGRRLTMIRHGKKMHRSAVQGVPTRRGSLRWRENPRVLRSTHNMGDQP